MAIKLMLKNTQPLLLHFGLRPRALSRAIVDFMNKRGSDKIMYAGYFPMGLSLDRIFAELAELPNSRRGLAQVPARQRREAAGA
ncbi:hypothetical protein AB5I41_14495 [Sphingomonas sp. MMS24-JH45]